LEKRVHYIEYVLPAVDAYYDNAPVDGVTLSNTKRVPGFKESLITRYLRKEAASHFTLVVPESSANTAPVDMVRCMATDIIFPKEVVRAAHIYDVKFHATLQHDLGDDYSDINDSRNGILVVKAVEYALALKYVVIVPALPRQGFKFHLLNPDPQWRSRRLADDMPVDQFAYLKRTRYEYPTSFSQLTYGDLEGLMLKSDGPLPGTRPLQFMYMLACKKAIAKDWITREQAEELWTLSTGVLSGGGDYMTAAKERRVEEWLRAVDLPT